MRKNAIMNRVEGKIEILEGDCRRFAPLLEGVADRVIVGWLYDTEKYLPAALKIAKKGAVVHFHRAVSIGKIDSVAKNILKASKKLGYSVKIRSFRTVKPYGPSMEHVVWELKKN
jgi:tRNA wybutosine-synthesizing protein 2